MKSYEEHYKEFMDYLFHKPKSKAFYIWSAVFTILFIVPGIFFSWLFVVAAAGGSTPGLGIFAGLAVILVGLPLVFIDFIAVLLFIKIQKPHGIAKVIGNIALTVLGSIVVRVGIFLMSIFFDPLYDLLLLLGLVQE
jgi:hypothetical protein